MAEFNQAAGGCRRRKVIVGHDGVGRQAGYGAIQEHNGTPGFLQR